MKFVDHLLLKPEQVALAFHHVRDGLRQGQVAAQMGATPLARDAGATPLARDAGATLLDIFVSVFF